MHASSEWYPIADLVSAGLWPSLRTYLDTDPVAAHYPVFQPIRRVFDDVTFDGLVAEFEPQLPDACPYHVVYSDGDSEDLTEDEFQTATALFAHHGLHIMVPASLRRHLRVLDLCCGTKSVSRALRTVAPNAKIVTLDLDPRTSPTHCVDLTTWACPYPAGYFDIIWASPPCTEYSIAKTTGIRDFPSADRVVKACIRIIETGVPAGWVIENPVGHLRHRPFMQRYSHCLHTTTYCSFGFPYRKATNIWTNLDVELPRRCKATPCEEMQSFGHHSFTAQHGNTHTAVGIGSAQLAHEVPEGLIHLLVRAALRRRRELTRISRSVAADSEPHP